MHISNNQGMNSQDRITHLMAAWPKGTDVGDELRLEQIFSVYLEWERKLDFEQCWLTLLMRLKERATEPGLARRKARQPCLVR